MSIELTVLACCDKRASDKRERLDYSLSSTFNIALGELLLHTMHGITRRSSRAECRQTRIQNCTGWLTRPTMIPAPFEMHARMSGSDGVGYSVVNGRHTVLRLGTQRLEAAPMDYSEQRDGNPDARRLPFAFNALKHPCA